MAIGSPFLTTRLLARGRGLSRLVSQTHAALACVSMTVNRNTIQSTNFHTSCKDSDTELDTEAEETIYHSSLPIIPRRFNLTFDQYIKKKQEIRKWQRLGGVVFGVGATVPCYIVFPACFPEWFIPATTPEEIPLVFGMDPMLIYVGSVMGAGLIGMSAGFLASKTMYAVLKPTAWKDFKLRNEDFLSRLDQHRFVKESDFEDDFYGEKIKTLSDYRHWIREHEKKRENHAKFNPPK